MDNDQVVNLKHIKQLKRVHSTIFMEMFGNFLLFGSFIYKSQEDNYCFDQILLNASGLSFFE